MGKDPTYGEYWRRKRLLRELPVFAVVRWWPTEKMSPVEGLWWREVGAARRILDVGAGDLRVRDKILAAGFDGIYHTQDVGSEFEYTYSSLDDVEAKYDAVLCLDVLEHLRLTEGLALLEKVRGLLLPGGVLVLQTPNGRCIRNQLGTDMTHVQLYNLPDLWSHLTTLDFSVAGWRVQFSEERPSFLRKLRSLFSAFIITRLLGADYCDNILLVARQRAADVPSSKI